MCTVLQQHLIKTSNGYTGVGEASHPSGLSHDGESCYLSQPQRRTPASPWRLKQETPVYSYLGITGVGSGSSGDGARLKGPVEPYDRKTSTPTMHFHVVPLNPDGSRPSSRMTRNAYMASLHGRRSRSHSRTAMRLLVDEIQQSAPRPRSPHMNNEEPINLSHYPDGKKPEDDGEGGGRKTPIERDDFPAPPFAFSGTEPSVESRGRRARRIRRRRHWSEPGKQMPGLRQFSVSSSSCSESEYDEQEGKDEGDGCFRDPQLDKREAVLKKISNNGMMGKVFLTEVAVERERRKLAKSSFPVDPRSAARTPSAHRMPHFRLRYENPVNASPSRVAHHSLPWDDACYCCNNEDEGGRRSAVSPFFPVTPTGGHFISPLKPQAATTRSSTLPSRFSPGVVGEVTCSSADFSSKSDFSDGGKMSTPMTARITPESLGSLEDSGGVMEWSQAANIYPIHLLLVTNYRLPGDVNRASLERHLGEADFEAAFKMSRQEFYTLPYWKRCDIKRRLNLF